MTFDVVDLYPIDIDVNQLKVHKGPSTNVNRLNGHRSIDLD
jgi:hypothetical protein